MDKARGNEREISCSFTALKQSFVWAYLKDDGHLRGYSHDSCSSTQGCHVGRKRIKWGPTTMRFSGNRFLMKKKRFML